MLCSFSKQTAERLELEQRRLAKLDKVREIWIVDERSVLKGWIWFWRQHRT